MAFSIKKETRVSKYSLPLALRNRNGKIIKFVSGAALAASLFGCPTPPTGGLPYIEPVDRNIAIELVESKFAVDLSADIVFQRDVKLVIQDASGDVIDLIADGYNADKKIIYELTSYYDIKTTYYNGGYTNNYLDPTGDILTDDELGLIKNYSFGGYYFCNVYSDYEDIIDNILDKLIQYYKNLDTTTDLTASIR
ncbi:MAG: hypothetical protein KA885_03370 [Spirochaetes bacterium]|nr:hypothetical protein [Spirochaetota bacterium]